MKASNKNINQMALVKKLYLDPCEEGRIRVGKFETKEYACGDFILRGAELMLKAIPWCAVFLAKKAVEAYGCPAVRMRAEYIFRDAEAYLAE